MRFMVIVKANNESEKGVLPDDKLLADMGKFNEELVKAGVLLAAEGLHPSSKGARVRFSGNKRTVVDGPFSETKELIACFWLFQVKSLEEAIQWVKRSPNPFPNGDSEVEIRQVFEADDFGAEQLIIRWPERPFEGKGDYHTLRGKDSCNLTQMVGWFPTGVSGPGASSAASGRCFCCSTV